jgi:hypothetical protein
VEQEWDLGWQELARTYLTEIKIKQVNNMEGLAKVANVQLNQQVEGAMKERALSPEEFKVKTDGLKNKYNMDTDYLIQNDSSLPMVSYAITDKAGVEQLKNNKYMQEYLKTNYKGNASSLIKSVPLEDVVLHETGHVANKDTQLEREKKSKLLKLTGGLTGLAAATVPIAPNLSNKTRIGAGLGLAGLSGAQFGLSQKKVNDNEDEANQFVMNHWTDELGSKEKAEEKFNNSLLPQARASYDNPIKTGLTMGSVGALGGLATMALSKKMMG